MSGDETAEIYRRLDSIEGRLTTLEKANDGLPAMIERMFSECLEVKFPPLWTAEREKERAALAAQREKDRQELVADIKNVIKWPMRVAQYLLPILTIISILVSLLR